MLCLAVCSTQPVCYNQLKSLNSFSVSLLANSRGNHDKHTPTSGEKPLEGFARAIGERDDRQQVHTRDMRGREATLEVENSLSTFVKRIRGHTAGVVAGEA